jgi:hypothetical protein
MTGNRVLVARRCAIPLEPLADSGHDETMLNASLRSVDATALRCRAIHRHVVFRNFRSAAKPGLNANSTDWCGCRDLLPRQIGTKILQQFQQSDGP